MKQVDYKSKETFSKLLNIKGFNNIKETYSFCRWDIEADWNGTTYYFELKSRSFPSYLYGDSIIDDVKVRELSKKLNNDFSKVYIVNLFTNNVLTVVPFNSEHTLLENKVCPKSTYWNKTKVDKTLYSWKNSYENMYFISDKGFCHKGKIYA